MPKPIPPLTFSKIKAAKPKDKTYRLNDGGGLCLMVYKSGLMKWNLEYTENKKRKAAYLGNYPEFSLAEAREWREAVKKRLAHGLPAIEKKGKDQYLFSTVYKEWFDRWRHDVTEQYSGQVARAIEANVLDRLGPLDIRHIKPSTIVESLRPIEARGKLEYLRRVKSSLKLIFDYAVNTGLINFNVVGAVGSQAFRKAEKGHFTALPPSQLKDLVTALESSKFETRTKLAIYWQFLTMCRPAEATEAEWKEIDLKAKTWTIPPERMKRSREHIIPLTPLMLEFLAQIKAINLKGVYLFEGRDLDKPMNRENLRVALRRSGLDTTAHGLRATASTLLNESGLFRNDVIEAQLSHVQSDKTRMAYNRASYLEERREMLIWLGNEVMKHKENITL